MHPMELAGVLKGGARATRRQKETGQRGDDVTDLAGWKAQAKAAGYEHGTVIDPEVKRRPIPDERERLLHGYNAALPVLSKQFESRATMYASVARTAAARGLIASGVESAADIDRITAAMREHGVQHGGKQVPLMWAEVATEDESAEIGGRRSRVKITTTLHVAQEEEAMTLASRAAADRSGAFQPEEIERAVLYVSERDGLDFTEGHGAEQRHSVGGLAPVAGSRNVAHFTKPELPFALRSCKPSRFASSRNVANESQTQRGALPDVLPVCTPDAF